MDSGNWDGSPISISVDGLNLGTYNYTIVIYDNSENWVTDTVYVYVNTATSSESSSSSKSEESSVDSPGFEGVFELLGIIFGLFITRRFR